MTMPPFGVDQHLLGYLQAWRRLLEQWTAMVVPPPPAGTPYAMPAPPDTARAPAPPRLHPAAVRLPAGLSAVPGERRECDTASHPAAAGRPTVGRPAVGRDGDVVVRTDGTAGVRLRVPENRWGSAVPAGESGVQAQKVVRRPESEWDTVGVPVRDVARGLDVPRSPQAPTPPPDRWNAFADRFRLGDGPVAEQAAGQIETPGAARTARSAFRDVTAQANRAATSWGMSAAATD